MAQNVLIAGHSYVSRLQRFMTKTNRQNGGWPKCGRSGLFNKLAEHRPCLLILEIGTNDLDSTMADAAKLARDLFSVGETLRS